jgi:hypothetical protein
MKNKNKVSKIPVLWLVLIVALFAFSTTACFGQSGGGRIVNNASALKEYLDSLPANSPDKPIKVTINANIPSFSDINRVIKSANKYVSLDLSGSPLTTIPYQAFAECTPLAGIIIPNNVTSIGELAFDECHSLSSINIPNSLTSIGAAAFRYCPITGSITIPNGVTRIEMSAFAGCEKLAGVTIGNRVTSIEAMAFSSCISLTSVIIGNSVTSIGASAFMDCTSLTSITIPNNVTNIGRWAFTQCDKLTSVTFNGTIIPDNFGDFNPGFFNVFDSPFDGDLRDKYLAGGRGTYTRSNEKSETWTKQ